LPTGGGRGGGHTRGFRQKTIPDRREFELIEGLDASRRKWLSLGWGFRLQTF